MRILEASPPSSFFMLQKGADPHSWNVVFVKINSVLLTFCVFGPCIIRTQAVILVSDFFFYSSIFQIPVGVDKHATAIQSCLL